MNSIYTKMSVTDVIECRKVGLEDYDEVIDIRTDVFGGRDYLPALYKTMMANHTGYVVTVNQIMVAFECLSFIDDGETAIIRSLRLRKGYEGRGLTYRLRDVINDVIVRNPRAKRYVYTMDSKTIAEKNLAVGNLKLVVHRKFLFYQGKVSAVIPNLRMVDSTTCRILNRDDLKKLLSSKVDTDRLFPHGRIIVDWVPYRLLASNVDHFFNDFCHILGSGDGNSGRIECVSVAIGCIAPSGIRYDLEIYGNFTEESFLAHVREHLRKCSTFDSETINFFVHYEPGILDADVITKSMQHFGMNWSDLVQTDTMYGIEGSSAPMSKY